MAVFSKKIVSGSKLRAMALQGFGFYDNKTKSEKVRRNGDNGPAFLYFSLLRIGSQNVPALNVVYVSCMSSIYKISHSYLFI